MKCKNFKTYLEKRLNKNEIKEIELQAKIELNALHQLQNDISSALSKYMGKEKIGFNEVVRRLQISPAQFIKIQKREANLTLSSLAHIAALFKKTPHLVFKDK